MIKGSGVENEMTFNLTGTINKENMHFEAKQEFEDGYEVFFWGTISETKIDGDWGYKHKARAGPLTLKCQ